MNAIRVAAAGGRVAALGDPAPPRPAGYIKVAVDRCPSPRHSEEVLAMLVRQALSAEHQPETSPLPFPPPGYGDAAPHPPYPYNLPRSASVPALVDKCSSARVIPYDSPWTEESSPWHENKAHC